MIKNKEQELIYRVWKLIKREHFSDHKLGPYYCSNIRFDRGVGGDIAEYIEKNFPEKYNNDETENKKINE